MKQLEHIRTLWKPTARREAKTPYGALVALAQLAPEKRRLQQERANWEKRIHKIEARVKEIAGIEEQLWAVAQCEPSSADHKRPAAGAASIAAALCKCQPSSADHKRPAEVSGGLPPGFTEVTIRY